MQLKSAVEGNLFILLSEIGSLSNTLEPVMERSLSLKFYVTCIVCENRFSHQFFDVQTT